MISPSARLCRIEKLRQAFQIQVLARHHLHFARIRLRLRGRRIDGSAYHPDFDHKAGDKPTGQSATLAAISSETIAREPAFDTPYKQEGLKTKTTTLIKKGGTMLYIQGIAREDHDI